MQPGGFCSRIKWICGGLALVTLVLTAAPVHAQVTSVQRNEITALKVVLRKAGNLARSRELSESAELVKDAQRRLETLANGANADLLRQLEPIHESLQKVRAELEFEGVPLPAMKPLVPDPAAGGISFSKRVAPVLISRCGQCHVNQMRGMFSMANYETLMKGNADGLVVIAGDADGSRIIELIESGDMPRGGGRVSEEELAVLKQWIVAGAKFDGDNPAAALATLAPDAAPTRPPALELTMATGQETVHFAEDLAPVLAENCAGCHGNGQRAAADFDLSTFQAMLRGGDNGPVMVPGNPDDSLLIQKLKGTAGGERMPRGRPPLSDEVIDQFATWIREGAAYDGGDPALNVVQVAALAKALRQSHEELSADRVKLAEENWRLGMPGINSTVHETDNFLLIGRLSEDQLQDYGRQAESLLPKIKSTFRVAIDGPMIKGRMTLFLFGQRYDYSEFGKMVEKRDLPGDWRGHWQYTIVDAYGASLLPSNDEYSVDALLGQQIAAAYVASLGANVPRWFAEGAGRVAATRLERDDARTRSWDDNLGSVLAVMKKADDFQKGQLSPEDAGVASYSFVKFLMSDPRRFSRLLTAVKDGTEFSQALVQVYGSTESQLAELWVRSAARDAARGR